MPIPWVEELQFENWTRLTVDKRLEALNQMEFALSQQEGREPCSVGRISEKDRVVRDSEPGLRGQYDPGKKEIQIDPILLSDGRSPYQAVETYFHEARHAYQDYAVEHPEIHSNVEQVTDWKRNNSAYIDKEDVELGIAEYSHYRWQPVEADANREARDRTNELYTSMFQDTNQYPSYRAGKEEEFSKSIDRAISELNTTDYEQEARLFMLSKYDAKQDLQKQDNLSQTPTVAEASSSGELESGEDYDYSYGYGP